MLNKRNPFEKIGKVIKYELKHSYRILLPMYGVLLFVGFLIGIFSVPADIQDMIRHSDSGFSMHYSYESSNAIIGNIALLSFLFTVLSVAIIIVTIVILNRRFKKSMLEDEAYLNLALPVTIGEHLWGRFIADVLWMFCSGAVIVGSFLLCFIRFVPYINYENLPFLREINESGLTIGWMVFDSISMYLIDIMMFITFCFLLHSFGTLFKKNNRLAKFITAIVMIFVYTRFSALFPHMDVNLDNLRSMTAAIQMGVFKMMILNIFFIVFNFAATHVIFSKKLDLE